MKNIHYGSLAASALVMLAACGGGNSGTSSGADGAPKSPVRGVLIENPPPRIQSVSATDFAASLSKDVIGAAGWPVCGVDVHYIKYTTIGGMGEATDASAALMVPTGSDQRCTGPRPIVIYAHGTVTQKNTTWPIGPIETIPPFKNPLLSQPPLPRKATYLLPRTTRAMTVRL